MAWNVAAFDRRLMLAAVEQGNARFDPGLDLPTATIRNVVYHSKLREGVAHPLRDAFHYAGALLDHGGDAEAERACRVLRRALQAQDTDPESRTYGIWPWFWEEPLPQMSPPDWNWADFCGQAIFLILHRHAARLPADLREALRVSLGHAVRSIERRNMGPHYTNIAFLGTFVTLAAAEMLGWDDLHAYARERLERVAAWTERLGTFSEFNSPTYTTVTLTVLTQMLQYWEDGEAKALAERLHRRAWEHLAAHWHAPTRQWAGPHSRCYATDLRENAHAQILLQKATRGALAFYDPAGDLPGAWEASRSDYACPPEVLPRLLALDAPTQHRECFDPGREGVMPVVGTTYLARGFALGSCSRQILWNQCRPLLLYWGDAGPAHFLRVRLLHDGYDFSSGNLFSVQEQGCVLAGINFASDGGDVHPSLDKVRDGTFRARDLRLRVEIAGAREGCEEGLRFEPGEPARLDPGGLPVWLCVPAAEFGGRAASGEVTRDGRSLFLDVVFVSGEEREIRWAEVGTAFAALALAVDAPDAAPPTVGGDAGALDVKWQSPAAELRVRLSRAVQPGGVQQTEARAWLNGAEPPAPRLSNEPLLHQASITVSRRPAGCR